ncbi:MAG: hypothetical protein GY926_08780 [bacterium]|nr:hypothetical protein [bacterium]
MSTKPTPETPIAIADKPDDRTVIVHFHGMGEQKRYEEVSQLVDHLHSYARQDPESRGSLKDISARLDTFPHEGDPSRYVNYIRMRHVAKDAEGHTAGRWHHFFEVYWAPNMAGGAPAHKVAIWIMKQILTPFRISRSPWRSRQRLRRAALMEITERTTLTPEDRGLVKKLLGEYDAFAEPKAEEDFPNGTFDNFCSFISKRTQSTKKTDSLLKLANQWRGELHRQETRNAAALVTFGLFITLVALVFLALANWAIETVSVTPFFENSWIREMIGAFSLPFQNAWFLIGTVLGGLGVWRFLSHYVGDVYFWTTYEETDEKHKKRRSTLEQGCKVLEQILRDPRYDRVVVTAHSLGTAVAADSILELARRNRSKDAHNSMDVDIPMGKLDAFITWGSPIDKIHYFFESYQSRSYRYGRVVEELRGDVGTIPFAKNRKPYLHWINIWDQADLISGPLQTPSSAKNPNVSVDNLQVRNGRLPFPAAAHGRYTRNPEVLSILLRTIFYGVHSFASAPRENGRPDYGAQRVGARKSSAFVKAVHVVCLLLPWAVGIAVVVF